MVFGFQLSVARVGSTVNFLLMGYLINLIIFNILIIFYNNIIIFDNI